MVPFTVDMPTLYERFVAQWLDDHLPTPFSAQAQQTVTIHESPSIQFDVDIVIRRDSEVVAVADTKYKQRSQPDTSDIEQVVAYAEAYDVEEAYLVYPEDLSTDFEFTVGDIRVRDLQFILEGDLAANGDSFQSDLLRAIRAPLTT